METSFAHYTCRVPRKGVPKIRELLDDVTAIQKVSMHFWVLMFLWKVATVLFFRL